MDEPKLVINGVTYYREKEFQIYEVAEVLSVSTNYLGDNVARSVSVEMIDPKTIINPGDKIKFQMIRRDDAL